jgi:DNA replication protein DnaC
MNVLENFNMMNMTSYDEEIKPFKPFSIDQSKVIKRSICKCGNEYVSEYITPLCILKKTTKIREKCNNCEEIEHNTRMKILKEMRTQQRIDNFLKNPMIPPKYYNSTFDNYFPLNNGCEKARNKVSNYTKDFAKDGFLRNLLIIGGCGVGKTHLTIALCKQLSADGIDVYFVSVPRLLTIIRGSYSKSATESEKQIMNILLSVSVLILDDIGAEQGGSNSSYEHNWSSSKIFEILDGRQGKHTIYTSNLHVKELPKKLGARNFSRMMNDTDIIKIESEDYRLRDFKKR